MLCLTPPEYEGEVDEPLLARAWKLVDEGNVSLLNLVFVSCLGECDPCTFFLSVRALEPLLQSMAVIFYSQ